MKPKYLKIKLDADSVEELRDNLMQVLQDHYYSGSCRQGFDLIAENADALLKAIGITARPAATGKAGQRGRKGKKS